MFYLTIICLSGQLLCAHFDERQSYPVFSREKQCIEYGADVATRYHTKPWLTSAGLFASGLDFGIKCRRPDTKRAWRPSVL